jgi:hypothetical protein
VGLCSPHYPYVEEDLSQRRGLVPQATPLSASTMPAGSGSRRSGGSATRAGLAELVGTWMARGLHPLSTVPVFAHLTRLSGSRPNTSIVLWSLNDPSLHNRPCFICHSGALREDLHPVLLPRIDRGWLAFPRALFPRALFVFLHMLSEKQAARCEGMSRCAPISADNAERAHPGQLPITTARRCAPVHFDRSLARPGKCVGRVSIVVTISGADKI